MPHGAAPGDRCEYRLPEGTVARHFVVPAGAWQRAKSLGGHTLVGCTVAPAFEFERFEILPEGEAPEDHL